MRVSPIPIATVFCLLLGCASSEGGGEANGPTGAPAPVAPGATITVRSPLPSRATDVAVTYAGEKSLVLEQTAFE